MAAISWIIIHLLCTATSAAERLTIFPDGKMSGDLVENREPLSRHIALYAALQGKVELNWTQTTSLSMVRGKALQNKMDKRGASTLSCTGHKGHTLCKQDDINPTCPLTFKSASYISCFRLALYLYSLDQVHTEAKLTWWTNDNCTIHRTLCEVHHETHLDQHEDETFDFSRACDNLVQVHFVYSNQLNDAAMSARSEIQGNVLLKAGSPELIFSYKERGELRREEYLSVHLYERNNRGAITYYDEDLVHTRVSSGIRRGLWGQFVFHLKDYPRSFGSPKTQTFRDDYHISNQLMLDKCPDKWLAVADAGESIGTVVVLVLVPIGVIAILSMAVHLYLTKRRQFYAEKVLKARQIQVATTEATPPAQIVTGRVVQGVPIADGHPNVDVCVPAPLPPSRPDNQE